MNLDLNKQKLPDIYIRNGIECYLDTYRDKLVPITPEETIRQKVARWCENTLSVLSEVILIEQALTCYGVNSRDRADIVIHKQTSLGLLPIAIVECKSPIIVINDRTLEQGIKYADFLNCDYLFLTNGTEFKSYHYEKELDAYIELSIVPTYKDMLEGAFIELEAEPPFVRPSLLEMHNEVIWKNYTDDWIIAPYSKKQIIPHAINVFECFMDCSYLMDSLIGNQFTLIKDYGIRNLDYGNASGETYFSSYRSFLIQDNYGNHQFVSLGVNAYSENRTILCVAIDDFKKSHHALQLAFDSYMEEGTETIKFAHTGRIAVGHSGSGKASDLIKFVEWKSPDLIKGNKVFLGELPKTELLSFRMSEVQTFTKNLIDYALIRDNYRDKIKASSYQKGCKR